MPRGDNLERLSRYYGVSIDALMNGGGPEPETTPPTPPTPEPPPKPRPRLRLTGALAVLLALVLAVGALCFWLGRRSEVPEKEAVPEEQIESEEVTNPPAGTLPLLPPEEGD